jgi:hypothetical protein
VTAPKALTKRPARAQNTLEGVEAVKDRAGRNRRREALMKEATGFTRSDSQKMAVSKEEAVRRARSDLAKRLGVSESEIKEDSVEQTDFPDMALGAAVEDEMSGQMITPGWRIRLNAGGRGYEYRANKDQVRLYNYKGSNYRI